MANDYFRELKQVWIKDMVRIYGFIRREHLVKMFGISPQQATKDFRLFQDRNPCELYYDPSKKVYLRCIPSTENEKQVN